MRTLGKTIGLALALSGLVKRHAVVLVMFYASLSLSLRYVIDV